MHQYCKIAAIAAALCAVSAGAAVIPSGIPAGYTGKPFCCDTLLGHYQQIPGVVKAVFFDSGGEGVGFHETTVGNQGGSMRLDKNKQQIQADLPVDMQYFNSYWDWTVYMMTDSTGSQTWHISWIDPGEYQRMSCHVNIAGTYSICLHEVPASTPNTTCITFNEDTTTNVYINNLHVPTAAQIKSEVWHAWDTFPNVGQVVLDTGLYVVKYTYVQGGFNFDWIKFTLVSSTVAGEPVYENSAAGSLALHAVVSGNNLKLSYNAVGAGNARISLVNCAGRAVLSSIESSGAAGLQNHTFNLRNMRRGVYFVQVEQNGSREVRSLTITH
jgi:hypothetical protein